MQRELDVPNAIQQTTAIQEDTIEIVGRRLGDFSKLSIQLLKLPRPVVYMPIREHFQTIGHSLFALVFAIIGGAIGQWFARGTKCDSH